MKTTEEFIKELKENQKLKDEMMKVKTEDEAKKIMDKYEISGTVEELSKAIKESMMVVGELLDDELENVVGGTIKWGDEGRQTSAKDIVFQYNVGDRVECYVGWYFHTLTERGTIIERCIYENTGHDFYPNYIVKLDIGGKRVFTQENLSY